MSFSQIRLVFGIVGTLICVLFFTGTVASLPLPYSANFSSGATPSKSNIELLSYLPGESSGGITVWQEHVYMYMGDELVVFDVKDPARPLIVAHISMPYGRNSPPNSRSPIFFGNHAYVSNQGVLWQLDVSDPANPFLSGSFALPGFYSNLLQVTEDLFIVSNDHFLYLMTIQAEGMLETVGKYEATGYVADAWIQGEIAYIVESQLRVLDISDPSSPQPLYAVDVCCYYGLLPIENRLYALKGNTYNSVDIYSLSDPTRPEQIGSFTPDSLFTDAAAWQDYLLLLRWNELLIVDATDPTAPVQVGIYAGGHLATPGGVTISGGLAYHADRGLRILDLSTLPAVTEVSVFDSQLREAMDIKLEGSYAFVADRLGLRVLDLSSPMTPTVTAGLDMELIGELYLLANHKPFLYPSSNLGAYMVDISNPEIPALVGFEPGSSYRLFVLAAEEGRAYAVSLESYPVVRYLLKIFDTSKPSRWQELGVVEIPSPSFQLVVVGKYGYVTTDSGLAVLDLSDPTHPIIVNQIDGLSPFGVAAHDGVHLYTASNYEGLRIFDISDPVELTEVSRSDLSYSLPPNGIAAISDIQVDGAYLYLSDPGRGLSIFDVSDPTLPLRAGHYQNSVGIRRISVHNDLIGAVHGNLGFTLYRFVPPDVITTVDPVGATFEVDSGAIRYTFPAGTISVPISVTHGVRDLGIAAGIDGFATAGPIFRNHGVDLITGKPIVLADSHELSIHYSDGAIETVPEDSLALYWWNGKSWVLQPSLVDADQNLLTATTMQFGTFAVLGKSNRLYLPEVGR